MWSPIGSLAAAVEGVGAAEKPGCDTQGSLRSLILTGFGFFFSFELVIRDASRPATRTALGAPLRARHSGRRRARLDLPGWDEPAWTSCATAALAESLRLPGALPSPALQPCPSSGKRRRRSAQRRQPGACGRLGGVCEESSSPRRVCGDFSMWMRFAATGNAVGALMGHPPSLRAPGLALGALGWVGGGRWGGPAPSCAGSGGRPAGAELPARCAWLM